MIGSSSAAINIGSSSALSEHSLHWCGEPAVATMVGRDRGGRDVTLTVCERGVEEYDLRSRYLI